MASCGSFCFQSEHVEQHRRMLTLCAGSFLEFMPIFQLLKDKYTPEMLQYHVIVPSLPGYTVF
jgi:hypothetical protein